LLRQKPLRLIFDAETDGLLRQVTVCHCLVIKDADTGQVWRFRKNKREDTIAKGLAMLDSADLIFGHNIVSYDIPMFEKLFGWSPQAKIRDTLVLCRLLFPDQKDKDFRLHEQGKLDGKLIGSHNLESWGQRTGLYKGDYKKKKEAEGNRARHSPRQRGDAGCSSGASGPKNSKTTASERRRDHRPCHADGRTPGKLGGRGLGPAHARRSHVSAAGERLLLRRRIGARTQATN
jgi:hypothetical protein